MGQGGGVFTNSEELARNARMYRDWGRQADLTGRTNSKWKTLPKDYDNRFIYEKIGFNLSPLELQAAIGRVQLKKTEKIKKLRKRNFDYLYKELSKHDHLIMPVWKENTDPSWFAFPLSVKGGRGELVAYLEKRGIETRSMFAGDITQHPAYKDSNYRISGLLIEANFILKNSFWISCHPRLTQADREYIVQVFDDYYGS